jgi:hypothetical protein
MHMSGWLQVLVLMLTVSQAAAQSFEDTVDLLESGKWGWQKGENTCALNPQSFNFSQDYETLTISWKHSNEPAIYHLSSAVDDAFVAQVEGESRVAADGKAVSWMLAMTGSDSFCWHRMDWPRGKCTPNQVRCGVFDGNS